MAMESKRREGGEHERREKSELWTREVLKKNNYSKQNNMTEGCQKNLICVRRAAHTQWEKLRHTFASGTT